MSMGKRCGGSSTNSASQEATCYNCDCKGHYKADCWRPGGGKEGQRPQRGQRRGGNSQKQSANTATEPEQKDNYAFATSDLASIVKQLNIPIERRGAIIDSGATSHFAQIVKNFSTMSQLSLKRFILQMGRLLALLGKETS